MHSSATTRAADPRPARTRAAIYDAVERLAGGDGAEVSVNAVTRAAGVSRSAFYAQFSDLDDLAVAMLVDAFRRIGTDDVAARADTVTGADAHALAAASIGRLVDHIAHRRAFYRASLEWRLTSRVHETVVSAFADQVLATMRVLGERVPAAVDQQDAARFIAGGAVSILTAWLREDRPSAPESLVTRLMTPMPEWLVGVA